jgi:serine/threonine-protein kinase HipA
MADTTRLSILLYGQKIGMITTAPGGGSLFAFEDSYVANPFRPTLSLHFKSALGGLVAGNFKSQTQLAPFFSNLLPEGSLRDYLAKRADVKPWREFSLLWALGLDLPGAVTVEQADAVLLPSNQRGGAETEDETKPDALRFSLAGVQPKFSCIRSASGAMTIPAHGMGGSWIVKLPSRRFVAIAENEYSMMHIAAKVGIDVPELELLPLDRISGLPGDFCDFDENAFAIQRFDRDEACPVHIEDFAQVYGLPPDKKYNRINYKNIAQVIAKESPQDIAELIRRIVFNVLIGNADMHAKNWSLIYPDRRSARLSPAYDFVSTIPYIDDFKSALTIGRTKSMHAFSQSELDYLAAKAQLPEKLVRDTANETVARFREVWKTERNNLPLSGTVIRTIESHTMKVPLAAAA